MAHVVLKVEVEGLQELRRTRIPLDTFDFATLTKTLQGFWPHATEFAIHGPRGLVTAANLRTLLIGDEPKLQLVLREATLDHHRDPAVSAGVSFTINKASFTVPVDSVDANMSLNQFIRRHTKFSGTNRSCAEGGCGCCTVMLSRTELGATVHRAINSCLRPVLLCDGAAITTTEGVGNVRDGYDPVQTALADHNGSQCGFCSPGFVMSMYSLLATDSAPKADTIENVFDGNLCRCTGYRPILNAMGTFASADGVPTEAGARASKLASEVAASVSEQNRVVSGVAAGGQLWAKPAALADLYSLLKAHAPADVRMIVGNTTTGIIKDPPQTVLIDLTGIADLQKVTVNKDSIDFGGAVTITQIIDTLKTNASLSPAFVPIAEHLSNVANTMVRNVGSWAGNLMLANNKTLNFPSDLATCFTAAGAEVTIGADGVATKVSMVDFLTSDMAGKVLLNLHVPVAPADAHFVSYKVNPRRQCSHAYVNLAMQSTIAAGSTVASSPVIVFGGVAAHAVRATNTETFLAGKDLADTATLTGALAELTKEIVVNDAPGRVAYRQAIVSSIFYRACLGLLVKAKATLPADLQSASAMLTRAISKGSETYPAAPFETPAGTPMVKTSALMQAAGEALYTDDHPATPGSLFAAFALSATGNAKLDAIDAAAALAVPGVVDFVTAADVPKDGSNDIMGEVMFVPIGERVGYAGQAVGLVVATSQDVANRAAKLVSCTYSDQQTIISSIPDAIAAKAFLPNPVPPVKTGDVAKGFTDADVVVEGEQTVGSQYHLHMETQSAVATPTEEDGYKIYSSCQWPYMTSVICAATVGTRSNKVETDVKRVGGAYGGKIFGSLQIAAACTLAAYKLRLPVRCQMSLESNMEMKGKRYPYLAQFKAGAKKDGTITTVQVKYYSAAGFQAQGAGGMYGAVLVAMDNCYKIANWDAEGQVCMLNQASNTAARAPGFAPAIFIMEAIVEKLAVALKMDASALRAKNFYKTGDVTPYGQTLTYCTVDTLWDQLVTSAEYTKRRSEVDAFNKANRWVKRGLSMTPVKYGMGWDTANYGVLINIFSDGNVQVNHSGVECGQGIHTKVAQVVAMALGNGVTLDDIVVTATNTNINPNSMCTGGSITSELNCRAALVAGERLRDRIAAVKRMSPPGSKWADIIGAAYNAGVDLSERYFVAPDTVQPFQYNGYCAALTEVEVDTLTGQSEVIRMDMTYDCGQSLNPDIDIGQIQGAYMMALGWLTTEDLTYDKNARLTNPGTWDYHVPSSQSIPIEMNIKLIDRVYNPSGVLGSKAVGEPPFCAAASAFFALKDAVAAARAENGQSGQFDLNSPATVEVLQQACAVDPSAFKM